MGLENVEWAKPNAASDEGKLSMPPFALPQGMMLQTLERAEAMLPALLLSPER